MPRPKILLVDDDPDFLKIAAEFLDLNGYDVTATTDLVKGREVLERNFVAVAFLDINFDQGDHHDKRGGLRLAIDTIATTATPKVILTVHAQADYARESLILRGKVGAAVEFLDKGNGLPQMVTAIERIVQRVKVFLSYSGPDREKVRSFYQQLQMSGLLPWMDKMDIQPGEDWEMKIRTAIRDADFAVVCLSQNGVDRSGPYQEEISLILKTQRERPPRRVYAVPARLDNCEIDYEELNVLHRVDLFAPEGYKQLLSVLIGNNQRKKSG